MNTISVKITYRLENGNNKEIIIKDISSNATEAQITAVANKLIEKRGHYQGSLFQTIAKIDKITTTTETF